MSVSETEQFLTGVDVTNEFAGLHEKTPLTPLGEKGSRASDSLVCGFEVVVGDDEWVNEDGGGEDVEVGAATMQAVKLGDVDATTDEVLRGFLRVRKVQRITLVCVGWFETIGHKNAFQWLGLAGYAELDMFG